MLNIISNITILKLKNTFHLYVEIYLCISFPDKHSQQFLEQTHDKIFAPLALNNSEMIHRNTRGSCQELSEVTSTLLHATAS